MVGRSRKPSMAVWAWVGSAGFHLLLLGVFAMVHFSEPSGASVPAEQGVTAAQVKRISVSEFTVPKPKIRKISRLSRSGRAVII